jgi:hypothetical protein
MEESAKNADHSQNMALLLPQILRAGKDELFQIIQEQSGEFLLALLRNPALDENHLQALFKRRGLPEELFTAIYSGKRLLENYKVKLAMLCHPETPSHIASTLIPQVLVFDLARISRMPAVHTDLRIAAEREIIKRLPTQPLGNKMTLARQGTAAVVEMLLKEGQPQVVEACLDNQNLKEGAVHQFVSSFQANADSISMVARHQRWKVRPNIRLAILKNPRTPAIWLPLFCQLCPNSLCVSCFRYSG